ncbi:urea ABC transporter permease subunit UrtB [Photobacterium sanctipauli]|uniref:Urea ABC transporter permease subunit UrtB n=1 Tax=Photobacterium sanctipauli TaxID=1342794 RepID=A0A2T3P1E9_9GAMM|nr:urea ABC transporter permease subunit UrtB [Photobacterium sanctipauli]PSW22298.1 urea ABC transporter permease subunit UrtB [Photobacterium sanctipauli]
MVGLFPFFSYAAVNDFQSVEKQLSQRNFTKKQQAIEWVIHAQPSQTATLLKGLIAGDVFYHRKNNQLFFIEQLKQGDTATRLFDNSQVVIDNKRDFRKVGLNNRLRSTIRIGIAKIELSAESDAERLSAAKRLLGNSSDAVISLVEEAYPKETSEQVKDYLALILAMDRLTREPLESDDSTLRLQAIETLSDSLEPSVFRAINSALDVELAKASPDTVLVKELEQAVASYEQSQRVYNVAETLFFGLSLGSVLVLAGIGLAITFGVMGVINMAHGELIMLGAYTTYVMQQLLPNQIGLSLVLSIPVAFVVSGLVGIAIERGVIRFLYGRPLETLLATFGISLILQQAVRTIFSPLNRSVSTPDWMTGMLEINPMLSLTYNRLYIIIFCLFVFTALVLVLKKTPLGLQVRAVSQNRAMAKAMGVRSEWVDAMTFGLGSGVAGVAGVALSQLTNVGPNMGQSYIIDSFMVVVFGGVGNLWGTLVAGLSLGMFNKLLEPWAGAVLAKILVLVFIILFIQKRPRGLFPQRGRAVEG